MIEQGAQNEQLTSEKRLAAQVDYFTSEPKEIFDQINKLEQQTGPMAKECLYTFAIPAYKEGAELYEMLERNYVGQKQKNGEPFDPSLYEVVIFVNCNQVSEIDQPTLEAAQRFRDDHPELNIAVCVDKIKHPLNEEGKIKRKMGLVYKILADLVVLRNLLRDAPDEVKANHVLRTGGADAEGKSDYYLSDVLQRFIDNPELVQYKSEARLPDEVRKKIPSADFVYLMEEAYNRLLNNSVVGLGSYRTALYCEAQGFDPEVAVAEEVKLSEKYKEVIEKYKYKTAKSSVHNAFDNPARFLFAHSKNFPMSERYSWFNDPILENEFRSFDWKEYLFQAEPETLVDFIYRVSKMELGPKLFKILRVDLGVQSPDISIQFDEQSHAVSDLVNHFEQQGAAALRATEVIFLAMNSIRDEEKYGRLSYRMYPLAAFLTNPHLYRELVNKSGYFGSLCDQIKFDTSEYPTISEFLQKLKPEVLNMSDGQKIWEVALKHVLDHYLSNLYFSMDLDGMTVTEFADSKQIKTTTTELVFTADRSLDSEAAISVGDHEHDWFEVGSEKVGSLRVHYLEDGLEVVFVNFAFDSQNIVIHRAGEQIPVEANMRMQAADTLQVNDKKFLFSSATATDEFDFKITKIV